MEQLVRLVLKVQLGQVVEQPGLLEHKDLLAQQV
jgi:hypothetical protein